MAVTTYCVPGHSAALATSTTLYIVLHNSVAETHTVAVGTGIAPAPRTDPDGRD